MTEIMTYSNSAGPHEAACRLRSTDGPDMIAVALAVTLRSGDKFGPIEFTAMSEAHVHICSEGLIAWLTGERPILDHIVGG